MEQIGVGVIGVGFMGANHARAYASLTDADLIGVADIDRSRAETIARELGVDAFLPDELLADPAVEAVSICTNDEQHVRPTLDALAAKKHVLLEKPIATSLDDADRILSAAERSSGCFLVGHILRFEPRYVEAKRLVETGEIGDVVSIYARRLNALGAQNVLKGRVSVLSFLGVHDFDICSWLAASAPVKLTCEARRGVLSSRGFDVEDQTFTLIRFANDAIACVEAGWVLPDAHPRRADFALEVIGTQGVINIELMAQGVAVCTENGYRFPSFGHGIEYELEHFLKCARGEQKPRISGQDARVALSLSLAAQTSAREGRSIGL